MSLSQADQLNLRLCQAILPDGRVVDIRQSGSVFPTDDMAIWHFDETRRVVHLKRHVYPTTKEHAAIVGDRIVVEPARDEEVPYGQRILASGWAACVVWLAEHAILDTLVSPVLKEAIERAGKTMCVAVLELPDDCDVPYTEDAEAA